MSLDADQVVDRRRLKRSLVLWRVVAIVAVAGLALAAVGRLGGLGGGDYVARLRVAGLIVDEPERLKALAGVAKDVHARALLVRIDSPGGTVVGGESLYGALRAVAEKKPVVAVMGEVATSAAYMTAIGADHIVARQGSLTGSIGVILQSADLTGLLERLGIKPEIIKSGAFKAQPNPLEPFSPQARQAVRDVVLDLYEVFVDMVAERRSMPRLAVQNLADGRLFSGRQALAEGLVDSLGGEPEARRWLAETHGIGADLEARDVKVGDETAYWRRLLGTALGKMLFSERLNLDGLVSLWHPGLI